MMGASGGRGPAGPQGIPGLDGAVQLVSQSTMTVANLLANFPASATYVGRYARVSDLYGAADEIMRCCLSGSTYYWRPQRTDYSASAASTGGTMGLTPLVTPPQMRITGTLLGNLTITPNTANAWPGCQFEITMSGTLGLFLATVTGLLGGSGSLLSGTTRRLIFDGSGFYSQ